ncbi:hypothetical protein IP510_12990 [Psychrobacter sp. NG254]|uniref:hypothetical protein n=1 Tax=Psychrobacter sp. NG254 TaxID=2782003 RepID=UPI001887051F|nr:hypothetical protein [Psychrobacter sp. NG254]MBF2720797.1 hypothetical protein [Psychrobacter sp. NG254]
MSYTFTKDLIDYTESSDDPMIRSVNLILSQFSDIDKQVPSEYRWIYSSVASITEQLKSLNKNNHKKMNFIYWNDQTSNIEAYCYMTLWRAAELIKSCINGLNTKETIVPAIATRSLLEISAVFLINANVLSKTFSQMTFPSKKVVTSTEVEDLVIKMIWGTRYEKPEKHLLQTNIMTSLQKVAKHPDAKTLMPTYEFLCDIAHPSFIGNTSYWSHIEEITCDNQETRVMSRLTNRSFNDDILDKTIWSLAWSSGCIKNSFEMLMHANRELRRKLDASQ